MRWSACSFNQLPNWMQDNEYLRNGYRPPLGCFRACFWSIFRQHTETVNIWTHLLACMFFLGLLFFDVLFFWSQNLSWADIIARSIFHLGAILCLGFSSAYHLFSCHSHKVAKIFSKLDYAGIALLITGSFIAWLQEAFYCSVHYKLLYFSLATLLGTSTVVAALWDKFGTPQFRPYRAGIFAALGLSKALPFSHWFFSLSESKVSLQFSTLCLVSMALLYLSGALLYACRVPERFFPGKCDILFSSHQIFHVLVILAALVHYKGLSELTLFRLEGNNGVCKASS